MTPQEIVRIAAVVAKNEGWQLLGPVELRRERSFLGGDEWQVFGRGPTNEHRSWVRINARTGEVIATGWRVDAQLLRAA